MFSRESVSEKAVGVARELVESYRDILDDDYSSYMASLKPGETVMPKGRIMGDESKRKLIEACGRARESMSAVFDEARTEAGDEMAEPPSAEAVSYIQTLRGRKRVSQTEIDAAIRKYGDNWSCYQAISDVAQKQLESGNGVVVREQNTLTGAEKFISDAEKKSDRFIREVQAEVAKDPDDLKARTAWFEMAMSGGLDGVVG